MSKTGQRGDYNVSRNQRERCDCGKLLTEDQAFYCSKACSDRYNRSQAFTRIGKVAEPQTPEEVKAFYRKIKRKMSNLQVEEKELVKSLTPPDDSPEAERKFREAICPNPSYWNKGGNSS